jgi:hypothetical protein
MAIPDYADPRSHKHFSKGFVGISHGDGNTGYKTSWDAISDAKPTSTMGIHTHTRFCVFCGNRAFPIQSCVGADPHGYACVCKEAMDEIDWQEQFQLLLNEQAKARRLLIKEMPKRNPDVFEQYAKRVWDHNVADIRKDFFAQSALSRLGITVDEPKKFNLG